MLSKLKKKFNLQSVGNPGVIAQGNTSTNSGLPRPSVQTTLQKELKKDSYENNEGEEGREFFREDAECHEVIEVKRSFHKDAGVIYYLPKCYAPRTKLLRTRSSTLGDLQDSIVSQQGL